MAAMGFEQFENDREITVAIRKVANGYVLKLIRPAKPYQSQGGSPWETHEMVFLAIEPCLEFARKFLQNPWETQAGS
jgi:hypothetical protein